MSAGICIMNRQAIAMAADSAVTIGDHAAIHNSANKLFSLSRIAPVGLIIYANASLMSVPMEIIVKEYKKQLADKSFKTLKEYVYDFLAYIESHSELFRFNINEMDYVSSVFADLMVGLRGDKDNNIRSQSEALNRPLNDKELQAAYELSCKQTLTFIDSVPKRPDYNFRNYVRIHYLSHFITMLSNDFSFNWLSQNRIQQLCEKTCEIFDTDFNRNGYAGIAIAGYGEDEIYPNMVHLHINGYLNEKLRYYTYESVCIQENNTASVVPLAQTDVMQTFLFGINDRFLSDLSQQMPLRINQNIDSIDDSLFAPGKKDAVRAQINGVTSDVLRHVAEIARNDYMKPIIQSVASLPIEEMALLAESMINITSLRRKVALDQNIGTVGGPIDVAIISKGDGFIWLKRKHYFDRKYNPQYFYSHFEKIDRGVNDEN